MRIASAEQRIRHSPTRAAYANGFAYLPLCWQYGRLHQRGPDYYYQQGGNVVTAATVYDPHAKIAFGANWWWRSSELEYVRPRL